MLIKQSTSWEIPKTAEMDLYEMVSVFVNFDSLFCVERNSLNHIPTCNCFSRRASLVAITAWHFHKHRACSCQVSQLSVGHITFVKADKSLHYISISCKFIFCRNDIDFLLIYLNLWKLLWSVFFFDFEDVFPDNTNGFSPAPKISNESSHSGEKKTKKNKKTPKSENKT